MRLRWRVWAERLQSLFLIVLVVSSLALSGFIWLGEPNELAIGHPYFYSSPMYGSQRGVDEFIRPSAVWLWTGNQELFRYNGTSATVQNMLAMLRKAQFLAARIVPKTSDSAAIPDKTPYLLFDFNGLLTHVSLWPLAMPIPRLPIHRPTSQMVALFQSGKKGIYNMVFPTGNKVFVGALKLPSAFAQWLKPLKVAVPYAQIPNSGQLINLPYASIKMPVYRWILYHPVATHVVDSFFLDPSLIQPIAKTTEMTLYSDGMQSVELLLDEYGNDLIFSCPSGALRGYRQTANQALQVAVPFMDSHGGFVGNQVLSGLNGSADRTNLVFQDVINGWPLFSRIDQIRVQVQNGMVTGLWHTLSYPGMEINSTGVSVLSGAELMNKLTPSMSKGLTQITLGYGVMWVDQQTIELTPVYQLQYRAAPALYLDAQTGQTFYG